MYIDICTHTHQQGIQGIKGKIGSMNCQEKELLWRINFTKGKSCWCLRVLRVSEIPVTYDSSFLCEPLVTRR